MRHTPARGGSGQVNLYKLINLYKLDRLTCTSWAELVVNLWSTNVNLCKSYKLFSNLDKLLANWHQVNLHELACQLGTLNAS